LANSTGDITVKVESNDEIGNFDRETTGQTAIISGVVKMKKYEKAQIMAIQEAHNKDLTEEEINSVHHKTEMKEITRAINYMEENKVDYYPDYYLEGKSIEIEK
jgi:hypothetical protein